MQIIIATLIALGFFIALNFVKAKSAKGMMRVTIYGARIISITIAIISMSQYSKHQENKGKTFFGNSIEEFDTKSFIGEWGWVYKKTNQSDGVISFKENGELIKTLNASDLTITGKWVFDESTSHLIIYYANETKDYLVEGKRGIKLFLTEENTKFLGRNIDIELINRDVKYIQSGKESDSEIMLLIVGGLFILLVVLLLLVETPLLIFRLNKHNETSENPVYIKLNIYSDFFKTILSNALILAIILTAFVEACK